MLPLSTLSSEFLAGLALANEIWRWDLSTLANEIRKWDLSSYGKVKSKIFFYFLQYLKNSNEAGTTFFSGIVKWRTRGVFRILSNDLWQRFFAKIVNDFWLSTIFGKKIIS